MRKIAILTLFAVLFAALSFAGGIGTIGPVIRADTTVGNKPVSFGGSGGDIGLQLPANVTAINSSLLNTNLRFTGEKSGGLQVPTNVSVINSSLLNTNLGFTGEGSGSHQPNVSLNVSHIDPNDLLSGYLPFQTNSTNQSQPSPSGSAGSGSGGNDGGSSYKTRTVASFSCAGQQGSVTVTFLNPNVQNATVEILYIGQPMAKVLSQTVTESGTTIQFIPQKDGPYQIGVSVGTDEQNSYFNVALCGPQTNATHTVTVNLAPVHMLILSKTVDYQNGLSKEFDIYQDTDSSNVTAYDTEISLFYVNKGNSTIYNATIEDSVPTYVVAHRSDIAFVNYPDEVSSDVSNGFDWKFASLAVNENEKLSYSVPVELTSEQIYAMPAPKITSQTLPGASGSQGAGSNLMASLTGLTGLNSAALLIIGAAGLLIVAGAVYLFTAGRKPSDEPQQ